MRTNMICNGCGNYVGIDKDAVHCRVCNKSGPLSVAIRYIEVQAKARNLTFDPATITADENGRLTVECRPVEPSKRRVTNRAISA